MDTAPPRELLFGSGCYEGGIANSTPELRSSQSQIRPPPRPRKAAPRPPPVCGGNDQQQQATTPQPASSGWHVGRGEELAVACCVARGLRVAAPRAGPGGSQGLEQAAAAAAPGGALPRRVRSRGCSASRLCAQDAIDRARRGRLGHIYETDSAPARPVGVHAGDVRAASRSGRQLGSATVTAKVARTPVATCV
eukprot:scaffold1594_cov401-Prasinococcus_capsulatus_cf.AAC.22